MSLTVPAGATEKVRVTVDFAGVVQGVGFRPTLHQLAVAKGLGGTIQNRSGVVRLVVAGPGGVLQRFFDGLDDGLPRQARLDSVVLVDVSPMPEGPDAKFQILESADVGPARVVIPADLVMCEACAREVLDPTDRRYGYPFTTCTDCGPRYTVVDGMPYDRQRTTLAAFPLCDRCQAEYDEPSNRRFHAESTACPACGPTIALIDSDGRTLEGAPLRTARAALARGQIVAVRGLGGFLLCVDPTNRDALARLREAKSRPHKPFALMARSLETAGEFATVSGAARRILTGVEAPIVVLDALEGDHGIALDLISPDTATVAVMLPTSPLHLLLAKALDGDPTPDFDALVMTSGNRGGEPICLSNGEALDRLGGIADLFLVHDREINLRNDDSLCVIRDGRRQLWRRARGFAPQALRLHRPLRHRVLAMGAELKNTIGLGVGSEVTLSPHVGDLRTWEAVQALERVVEGLSRFLRHEPEVVAVDMHPDMECSRLGRRLAERAGLELIEVQHHHAHAASCMAEHGLDSALGLAFDGTGLGLDGRIWGAELLDVDPGVWRRLATFEPVPLPGGDAAVTEPARQVVGRAVAMGVPITESLCDRLGVGPVAAELWARQVDRGVNAPMSHAAGRLFDVVSVLLGLAAGRVTYEGQAAIRLEAAARTGEGGGAHLSFEMATRGELLMVDWTPTVARLLERPPSTDTRAELAMAFHRAVARAGLEMARHGREVSDKRDVVLTGGVFMNQILAEDLRHRLEADGFRVWTHLDFPPNDGGLTLGQATIAGGL